MTENDKDTIVEAAEALQEALDYLALASSDHAVQVSAQLAGEAAVSAAHAIARGMERIAGGAADRDSQPSQKERRFGATISAQLERVIEILDSMATDLSIATESTQVRLMELEAQQRAARVRELNQLITPGGKAP